MVFGNLANTYLTNRDNCSESTFFRIAQFSMKYTQSNYFVFCRDRKRRKSIVNFGRAID